MGRSGTIISGNDAQCSAVPAACIRAYWADNKSTLELEMQRLWSRGVFQMMMIAFITFKSSLAPLFEGL